MLSFVTMVRTVVEWIAVAQRKRVRL